MSELSQKAITELGPGLHPVARGLYIQIDERGNRSWLFRFTSPTTRKRRWMGLGPCDVISLAVAKRRVLELRLKVFDGIDPIDEERAAQPPPVPRFSFRDVAELYITAHQTGWRNDKHRTQWSSTLSSYAYPILGDVSVKAVDTGLVMQVLERNVAPDGQPPVSLWLSKPETASRVRGRIESVLDYATARHWRQGDNPARWRGHIQNLLPKPSKVRPIEHMRAVPWRELPALWAKLTAADDLSALALRLDLATLLRTNELLGGRWTEIDRNNDVWTVPGERMKTARPFRVPLVPVAIAVLDELTALRQNDWLLPGAKRDRPLSNMAMLQRLRGLYGMGVTTHGSVRSGFRDWASEAGIAGEVAEMALAHTIKDKTEAAYRREDLLEPRRAALRRWTRFLTEPAKPATDKILPLHRR